MVRLRSNAISTPSKSALKSKSIQRTKDSTVEVYLRLRPLRIEDATLIKLDSQHIKTLPPNGIPGQTYSFTQVFDNAAQSELFDKVARPVAEKLLLEGKDGLIFTYGITGSGKTHTMEGFRSDPGLIYRTIDYIFNSVGTQQTPKHLVENDGQNSYRIQSGEQLYPNLGHTDAPSAIPSVIRWRNRTKETTSVEVDPGSYYTVFISLIELYKKQIHDLFEDFDSHGLERREKRKEIRSDHNGISFVANAVEIEVKTADEAVEYYTLGIKRRKTGSTMLNNESSRGHCVLNITLVKVSKIYDDHYDIISSNQLCLVDLAGSERTKRSGVTGVAMHEAGEINNSLGALRKCIRALRERESTSNVQYREYPLTRLFQSYFEGHGMVRMVLCVKPTVDDFQENSIAMEFGLQTQDVAVDYASPPKVLKRSNSHIMPSYATMYDEYFQGKTKSIEIDTNMDDEKFIACWIDKMKRDREKRKEKIRATILLQNETREYIAETIRKRDDLKRQCETQQKDLREREEEIKVIGSKLGSTERSRQGESDKIKNLQQMVKILERDRSKLIAKDNRLVETINLRELHHEKLRRDVLNFMKTDANRSEDRKRVLELLKKLEPTDIKTATAPSAPEMEHIESSSPVDELNPSTPETMDSHTQATTSNISSEAAEFREFSPLSPSKLVISSPNSGVPVVNPKYIRSLSCPGGKWVHHTPPCTINTGTVLQPKSKNGKPVKHLRSSHILDKDAAGYSLVHQDAGPDGQVKTSIYKGDIIPTAGGGAQVILNDREIMEQMPPLRPRAASDAQFSR